MSGRWICRRPCDLSPGCSPGRAPGIVAPLMGVAGGELLIPAIVLLYGVDIKIAGSLSLAVSLPTMLVAFARYSRVASFAVLRQQRAFVLAMAAGSIAGTVIGGLLLGVLAGAADQKVGPRRTRLRVRLVADVCAIEPLSPPALDSWLHSPRTIARAGWTGLGVQARTDIFNKRGRAMEDRLLYRVREVAVILNISQSKVYELFSSGDLESVKIVAPVWCGARIYAPMLTGFDLSTSLRDLVITR
jgi:hypothetical protein